MSSHVAEVVKANAKTAWIKAGRTSSCGGCDNETSCGVSSLSKLFGKRSVLFEVDNTLGVAAKDRVLVRYDDTALVRASFFGYVWPVFWFFLFALGGTFLKAWWSVSSEWPVIVAALCGLAVSAFQLKRTSIQSVSLERKILS